MADTVIYTAAERAQQELVATMAEMRANPLDKTVPGGKYVGTDGQEHDAHGLPIAKGKKASATTAADAVSRLAEIEKERAQLQILVQQQQAQAAAEAAAAESGAAGDGKESSKRGGKR